MYHDRIRNALVLGYLVSARILHRTFIWSPREMVYLEASSRKPVDSHRKGNRGKWNDRGHIWREKVPRAPCPLSCVLSSFASRMRPSEACPDALAGPDDARPCVSILMLPGEGALRVCSNPSDWPPSPASCAPRFPAQNGGSDLNPVVRGWSPALPCVAPRTGRMAPHPPCQRAWPS